MIDADAQSLQAFPDDRRDAQAFQAFPQRSQPMLKRPRLSPRIAPTRKRSRRFPMIAADAQAFQTFPNDRCRCSGISGVPQPSLPIGRRPRRAQRFPPIGRHVGRYVAFEMSSKRSRQARGSPMWHQRARGALPILGIVR
jgi:hypothetical protein